PYAHLCTLLPYPSVFLLHCYVDPPDLHSFPTRRSSDLNVFIYAMRFATSASESCPPNAGIFDLPMVTTSRTRSSFTGTPLTMNRSEEHTSELQSPYDLVCRLLLEKKKTNKSYNYQ